jgi:hypothetical protein
MSRSEALEFLASALEAVEYIHNENGDEYCPWCGNLSPAEFDRSSSAYKKTHKHSRGHRKDCLRQVALKKAAFGQ